VTEPLRISVDVACSTEHAFTVWTSGIGSWWPPDHTVSGRGDLEVFLQGRVGGRIFERTPDGIEHEWGEVTVWDPPARLSYRWHLHQDRAEATVVDIHFLPRGDAATRIEIEHRGWEKLGPAAEERREGNRRGWDGLLPHFVAAVEQGGG
jgi:uncharacterized protein YndB with AHSA1/START domain